MMFALTAKEARPVNWPLAGLPIRLMIASPTSGPALACHKETKGMGHPQHLLGQLCENSSPRLKKAISPAG